jgi:hypothetical protein
LGRTQTTEQEFIARHFDAGYLLAQAVRAQLQIPTEASIAFCDRLKLVWSGLSAGKRYHIRQTVYWAFRRQGYLPGDGELNLIHPVASPLDNWVELWEHIKGDPCDT